MITILTMVLNGTYRTFKIYSDGSAIETANNNHIKDFAVWYSWLFANGWRTVSETEMPDGNFHKAKGKRFSFVKRRESFREEWNVYLSEYADNLEIGYAYN